MATRIEGFWGANTFLSNTYMYPLIYLGIQYSSAEAAYQAQKCPERSKEFVGLTSAQASALGHQVELRTDWNKVRDQIMHDILLTKFKDNYLKYNMLCTGQMKLIYKNTWHSNYWGYCTCRQCALLEHHNRLGEILEQVREELECSNS